MTKEETQKLPDLASTETVQIIYKFPSSTVTIEGVTKGRAKSSCNAMCKKYKWNQE